jgi:hypothetical protein
MPMVVARETLTYAGIVRHAGDTFAVETAEDARIMRLVQLVDDAPPAADAEPPADVDDDAALPTYRRRSSKRHAPASLVVE